MADGNVETPYYLENQNDFTHLETEMSVIPPKLRQNYRNLETTVSGAFNEVYGQYLNSEQRRYMQGVQTIFTDHENAEEFSKQWDNGIVSIDVKDASINGNVYTAYSTGPSEEVPLHETRAPGGAIIRQYWAGRTAVHPLAADEIYPVDTKWLMTSRAFDETTDNMDVKDAFASIPLFIYTNSIGSVVVHEKVHGVQDYRLPLPILEAAAHFYQRELFKAKGWHCEIDNNMNIFADYYGQCVQDLGEDVHRLLFGNIEDTTRRDALLQQLKNRFSPEKIEELSKHNEYDWDQKEHQWIQWRKETEAQVSAEIKALKGGQTEVHENTNNTS